MRLTLFKSSFSSLFAMGLFIGCYQIYFRIRGPMPFRYWRNQGSSLTYREVLSKIFILEFQRINFKYNWGFCCLN